MKNDPFAPSAAITAVDKMIRDLAVPPALALLHQLDKTLRLGRPPETALDRALAQERRLRDLR